MNAMSTFAEVPCPCLRGHALRKYSMVMPKCRATFKVILPHAHDKRGHGTLHSALVLKWTLDYSPARIHNCACPAAEGLYQDMIFHL
jgi:hypothetical protein